MALFNDWMHNFMETIFEFFIENSIYWTMPIANFRLIWTTIVAMVAKVAKVAKVARVEELGGLNDFIAGAFGKRFEIFLVFMAWFEKCLQITILRDLY